MYTYCCLYIHVIQGTWTTSAVLQYVYRCLHQILFVERYSSTRDEAILWRSNGPAAFDSPDWLLCHLRSPCAIYIQQYTEYIPGVLPGMIFRSVMVYIWKSFHPLLCTAFCCPWGKMLKFSVFIQSRTTCLSAVDWSRVIFCVFIISSSHLFIYMHRVYSSRTTWCYKQLTHTERDKHTNTQTHTKLQHLTRIIPSIIPRARSHSSLLFSHTTHCCCCCSGCCIAAIAVAVVLVSTTPLHTDCRTAVHYIWYDTRYNRQHYWCITFWTMQKNLIYYYATAVVLLTYVWYALYTTHCQG